MIDFNIPVSWPVFPFLPVIRRLDEPVCGLLIAAKMAFKIDIPLHTIFHMNIYEVKRFKCVKQMIRETPSTIYGSMEELTQDGWTVD